MQPRPGQLDQLVGMGFADQQIAMSRPADAVYRSNASRCDIWAVAEQTPRIEVNPSNLNAEDQRLVDGFWENREHRCLSAALGVRDLR